MQRLLLQSMNKSGPVLSPKSLVRRDFFAISRIAFGAPGAAISPTRTFAPTPGAPDGSSTELFASRVPFNLPLTLVKTARKAAEHGARVP